MLRGPLACSGFILRLEYADGQLTRWDANLSGAAIHLASAGGPKAASLLLEDCLSAGKISLN